VRASHSSSFAFLLLLKQDLRYTYGINFRAVIAWLNGVWPLMPGFIAAVQNKTTSAGWTHTYYLAWLFGFFVSGTTYIILCKIWPPEGLGTVDEYDVYGTFDEITRGECGGSEEMITEIGTPVLTASGEERKSWDAKM